MSKRFIEDELGVEGAVQELESQRTSALTERPERRRGIIADASALRDRLYERLLPPSTQPLKLGDEPEADQDAGPIRQWITRLTDITEELEGAG
jgi:hypothetical protein